MSTWIFQANPKLYDVDTAVNSEAVIYWRVPQYTDRVRPGDRVLIWRSGKDAGLVGWGEVLTAPQKYDLTGHQEPYFRGGYSISVGEFYAPIAVWPAKEVAKEVVASILPQHRIITAPMGTVFPLGKDDLEALQPILASSGYDLMRESNLTFNPASVLVEAEPEPTPQVFTPGAKVTPALFLLSSTPDVPSEITIEGDALRLALVERPAVKALDDSWDAVGVYLLLGPPSTGDQSCSAYIGKAQGLRARVKSGHQDKSAWSRCLLTQRPGLHPFNASDISWLERRLIDVLLEAPSIDLINKTPPPIEWVPDYKAEILERTVVAILAILGVLGAYAV